jgi:hypothetical protein
MDKRVISFFTRGFIVRNVLKSIFLFSAVTACVSCSLFSPRNNTCSLSEAQIQELSAPIQTARFEVSQPVHDFGVVTKGGEFLHEFKIRNISQSELQIKKVAPA